MREEAMLDRAIIVSVALVAVLCAASTGAWSQESSRFPDWKGQWVRIGGGGQFDPSKPPVRGQQPPLTPEYQAILEANIAEARSGRQDFHTQVRCMPAGL